MIQYNIGFIDHTEEGGKKIKIDFLTICSLSKMGKKLKYLSGGQNKNKNLFWNKIMF
jgi:hypothetical protein